MPAATPEQMALFDADQIVSPQMGGAGDPDRIVYYDGGYATVGQLNQMKEAGDGSMWRLAGGARRRSMKRHGRRSMKRRGRSMKRKTHRRQGSRQ